MFVDVRQHRKPLRAVLLSGFLRQRSAQNIANRFRAVVVSAALAQAIQRLQEIIIKRYGDTLHRVSVS
ncbi:hypothetical protein D3C80_1454150 [compost metagenome]